MSNDNEQDGTPEDSSIQETESAVEDVTSLSDEDLNLLIEGTPDEGNVTEPTQPDSEETTPTEEGETEEVEQQPEALSREELEVRLAEQAKRIDDQAKFLERRSTELGTVKAELKRAIAEKEQLIRELELDSPVEAMRAEKQLERLKEQEEAVNAENVVLANRARFLQTVPKLVKPEQFDEAEIRATMLGDGAKEESVNNFLQNLDQQDPALVINLTQRAYLSKAIRQLVPLTQKLLAEREQWQKKAQNQGENIARSISRELKKPKALQASRPVNRNVSESVNLSRLSDAELDEIINKGSVNGINNI